MRILQKYEQFKSNLGNKNLTELIKEQLILEYKANERQKDMFRKWAQRQENSEEALELMDRFFDVYPKLDNKDVNSYRGIDKLAKAIANAESWQTGKEKKNKAKSEAVKKDFGNITGILTLSPEASQFYGGGTTWCTSMRDEIYHWLLHRIIGVEFYIVNNDLPDDNDLHKLSIHINWNKRYATIYNADNKVTWGSPEGGTFYSDVKTHEYWNMDDLKKFIDNDKLFNWMMEEFKETQKDAPKFVNSLCRRLSGGGVMETVFAKYHLMKYAIDDFLDRRDDSFNDTEYDLILDYDSGISKEWLEGFKVWFAKKKYEDILDLLEKAENDQRESGKKIALDDHVVIIEFFKTYLSERPNIDKEFYSAPLLFEPDDVEWVEDMVVSSGNTEAIEMFDEDEDYVIDIINKYYQTHNIKQKAGKNRMETHREIVSQALQSIGEK